MEKNLELESPLSNDWKDLYSSKTNCTTYFEKYVLSQLKNPLILCLDRLDRIFPYQEVAVGFLELLRVWYEKAQDSPIWQKLRLVLSYSSEVYIQLDNKSSPFNVGFLIKLPEFTQAQVQQLARLHKVNLTESEIQLLMELENGHPYLVEQALSHLKIEESSSLEEILQIAATEAGIYCDHLRYLLSLISERPKLLEAYRKIIAATNPIRLNSFQTYQLHSIGLVYIERDGCCRPFCNLYRQYFIEQINLLNSN
ncbi:MAG: AAA-like domain-containing protein [Cyanobacteria bacterium P01_F01_bin.143]